MANARSVSQIQGRNVQYPAQSLYEVSWKAPTLIIPTYNHDDGRLFDAKNSNGAYRYETSNGVRDDAGPFTSTCVICFHLYSIVNYAEVRTTELITPIIFFVCKLLSFSQPSHLLREIFSSSEPLC